MEFKTQLAHPLVGELYWKLVETMASGFNYNMRRATNSPHAFYPLVQSNPIEW
jgi:hypothetical protein